MLISLVYENKLTDKLCKRLKTNSRFKKPKLYSNFLTVNTRPGGRIESEPITNPVTYHKNYIEQ